MLLQLGLADELVERAGPQRRPRVGVEQLAVVGAGRRQRLDGRVVVAGELLQQLVTRHGGLPSIRSGHRHEAVASFCSARRSSSAASPDSRQLGQDGADLVGP